jgi:hypothetical protein
MKRLSVLSFLFIFTFGLTAGFVAGFADNAKADPPECVFNCKVSFYCTLEAHPQCSNPRFPYAAYLVSDCVGGPLYCPYVFEFAGCWRGSGKCMPLPIP